METRNLTQAQLAVFAQHLRREERSPGTVEKYLRDARRFAAWLGGRPVTKEAAAAWKEELVARGYAPVTVNSMVAAVNGLFACLGWQECRVKALKLQRRMFREAGRELSREEYRRLLAAAQAKGRGRLALLLETMGATGIRVSEVRYITLEAARAGRTEIALKGKIRTILLPAKLCRKLVKYARQQGIAAGPLFRTRNGTALSRKQIWAEMKSLCRQAGVERTKVFPHNLRHLFATAFYRACRDIVKLANVLGHSSMETTRLYLLTTGAEDAKQLERLGLVV